MFSVSPAEVLTIAVVALVIFGPRRLPELSRKAGRVLRELKDTAEDLRRGLEREIGPDSDLGQVRREMRSTLGPTDGPPPAPAPSDGER